MKNEMDVIERVIHHQDVHSFDEYPGFSLKFLPAILSPRRILVIQPSSIGDVLYITPGLEELRRKFPSAWIGFLVEDDAVAAVTGGVPDELIVARRRAWKRDGLAASGEIGRFLSSLRETKADLVINTHATARSAWYATCAAGESAPVMGLRFQDNAPIMSGNPFHHRWFTKLVPVTPLEPPSGVPSLLGPIGDLARRMGLGRTSSGITLAVGEEDRRRAHELIRETGFPQETRFFTVHTGSKWEERRYPMERWLLAIRGIAERWGRIPFFIGGPDDRENHARLRRELDLSSGDATGAGDLKVSAALIAESEFLFSGDTATVHLAAAVGTPTLTVSGNRWVGAYARRSLVLHVPGTDPVRWKTAITPECVNDAAGFLLGELREPSLPAGVALSWTGDSNPNEFFREKAPARIRKSRERDAVTMGLAWENLFSWLNESWGYPAARIAPVEALEWLGPVDDEARAFTEKRSRELNEWMKNLEETITALAAPRPGFDIREGFRKATTGFWGEFFRPIDLHQMLVEKPNADARAILSLNLAAGKITAEFLAGSLK